MGASKSQTKDGAVEGESKTKSAAPKKQKTKKRTSAKRANGSTVQIIEAVGKVEPRIKSAAHGKKLRKTHKPIKKKDKEKVETFIKEARGYQ